MSESETDNDRWFKSAAEEDDDASHETADDANKLPNYLTDPPLKRGDLNNLYSQDESAEEGLGCNSDSEGEDAVDIDLSRFVAKNERREYLVKEDGLDKEKDGDEQCALLEVGKIVNLDQ
eukprot:8246276-Ditylum_brightwellii.AAC.1